ncbi:MAG: LysR family transcriptional regulator [Leptolyngbyaceae cyanobacterium MO_188.B28]|nr:LysR family transcriptional regulator [Leptolyngbyaceae cyanobacterium MO_188.B28]
MLASLTDGDILESTQCAAEPLYPIPVIHPNPYNLKISQLRALVTVADCGNFSKAALALELSQSTVSHAIATLEEELGAPLLARGRHGAIPTIVGQQVIDQARQVLSLLEDIVQGAKAARGLQGGQVRIAAFRSVATHILPAVIAEFRRCFPDITVAITELDDLVEQSLLDGQVDIGFTNLPAGEKFETLEILTDDYLVLMPPDSTWEGMQLTWKQLATYPLIIPTSGNCGTRIRNFLKPAEVPINIAYEVREDSTMLGMTLQGLGATILPRLAVEPLLTGIKVGRLPVPLVRVIGAAMLADALHPPAVFAFWDLLKGLNQANLKPAA